MKRTKVLALIGAAALVLAMAGTTLAVTYATVDGHAPGSSESNEADFWGEDCTKLNGGEGDLGVAVDSYELQADYGLVVVKAGNGEFANTIFEDVSAGESVWADTNGDGVFNVGGPGGDAQISHIIFCDEGDETTTTTEETTTTTEETTTTTTFTGGEEPLTEPPTDTLVNGRPSNPADSAWLLLVALGVLLASLVVLAPARSRR